MTDPFLVTRYSFALVCLLTTVAGIAGQIYASRLSASAMPEERAPGAFLGSSEGVDRWRVRVMDRLRYTQESSTLYVLSGLVLVVSVVAALTINFPWFRLVSTAILVVLVACAGIAALRLETFVRTSKAERAAKHAENEKKYGSATPTT